MSIVSKEDLLNKQTEAKNTLEYFTCRVLVCSGTGCIASGAQKIYDEMMKLCENLDWVSVEMQKDVPHVGVVKTGCQGLCELGPLMRIEPYGYQYVHVQEEDCLEIAPISPRIIPSRRNGARTKLSVAPIYFIIPISSLRTVIPTEIVLLIRKMAISSRITITATDT